jgi:hypothetical protein
MHPYLISAIERYIDTVPSHIWACASAIRYDLLHGPSWSLIPEGNIEKFTFDSYASNRFDLEENARFGDLIQETYSGRVAETLRDYIEELPHQLWYCEDSGELCNFEPGSMYVNSSGEECDPDEEGAELGDFWTYACVSHKKIVEALFGKTIANNF